jgi:glucoamylase
VRTGTTLRIIGEAPFLLHWSLDAWQSPQDTMSKTNLLSVHYVDIDLLETAGHQVRFTFYWPEQDRWEGRDFSVQVAERGPESAARS